jgi:DNA-binding NarL/FixJ family response regulator
VAERLTIELIAAELGADLAARLSRAFAGTAVYIPERLPEDGSHILVRMLGRGDAERLSGAFGGERLDVPMGANRGRKRREQILKLRAEGMICSAIAREVGVTERYVYDILAEAEARARANQPGLFSLDPERLK